MTELISATGLFGLDLRLCLFQFLQKRRPCHIIIIVPMTVSTPKIMFTTNSRSFGGEAAVGKGMPVTFNCSALCEMEGILDYVRR